MTTLACHDFANLLSSCSNSIADHFSEVKVKKRRFEY